MLILTLGGFYSDKKSSLIKSIRELTEKKKRAFLIVPEQQTLTDEREMARLLPSYAPLYFEVSNFSRFANTGFRMLGGISREYVDRTRRMLVMWQTLHTLSPMLNMTKSHKEINTGMVEKAIGAIAKMQSASVSAEDLQRACESGHLDANGRLRAKMSDLSLIMSLYKKLLFDKYGESGDDVSELCVLLLKNPDYLRGTDIFFDGFTSFTEPQYKLISILCERANVHVFLTLPKLFENSLEYTETRLASERLKKIAREVNTEIKLRRIDTPRADRNPLISEITDMLWQNFLQLDTDFYEDRDFDCVRIVEAEAPYDACDFIMSDIRRRVIDGARYRDFAIILRDADEYRGLLSSSLSRYSVPAFISSGRDIADFEAIKLINSAYKAVLGGFTKDAVLSYAKCSLSGISRDACDEFEEYIHTWQLDRARFTDDILWNMSPRGLTEVTDADSVALIRINETRKSIISPLILLDEQSRDAKTVSEHARALFDFLSYIKLEAAISEQSRELKSIGEISLGEDNERLWKIICDSLDVMVDTLSSLEISRESFSTLLSSVFSFAHLGKIPAYLDEVTVGSADMIRLSGKKHVYLMPVNNGEFPKKIKDSAYFTEREKLTLSNMGLSIMPENEIEYARELFSFSRAFSYGSDSVTLVYTKAGLDFSKCERAPVIDRILAICRDKISPIRLSELSPFDFIYSKESALSSLERLSDMEFKSLLPALENNEYSKLLDIASGEIENSNLTLSKESIDKIYANDVGLSQSRIESYNSCPLSYFCTYNLKLSANERAKFDARNIGSLVHSILENFFKEVKNKEISLKTLEKDVIFEMVERHAKAYVNSISAVGNALDGAREGLMISRLTKSVLPIVTGLVDEFSGSDYIPNYFELGIGRGKSQVSPSPIRYKTESGKNVSVAGIIDRVDIYEKDGNVYVRVVDYKTGKKEFSPSDIDEGENLQMFLYLKAICDTKNEAFLSEMGVKTGGRLIPAGVIYVKTDLSDSTIDTPDEKKAYEEFSKKQSRKGMLLDDPVSIDAMNKSYIPVRFTKDGVPDKRTAENLYSLEEWENISKRVESSVLRIFGGMESGNVSPSPRRKGANLPCEYCPYKPICRKEAHIKS
jgi:ATP-dependent helicase/nuclease subunit B